MTNTNNQTEARVEPQLYDIEITLGGYREGVGHVTINGREATIDEACKLLHEHAAIAWQGRGE